MKRIIFVCTGNTCRSPMAQAIFAELARESGIDSEYSAESAGVFAEAGAPASLAAVSTLRQKGIDITRHAARQLDNELAKDADLIIAMTKAHKSVVIGMGQEYKDKVFTLSEWSEPSSENADIFDPYGAGADEYNRVYEQLYDYISSAVSNLGANQKNGGELMKIAIGSDHAGYELKVELKRYLENKGYDVEDCGTDSCESVDYPQYGFLVGEAVASGKNRFGIVVCGSGIGVSIAANKVKGVRAAACYNGEHAEMARRHNDANVLALGARMTDAETAEKIADVFLTREFDGGRHQKRVDMLNEYSAC